MKKTVRSLLERIGVLRQACDLDLLLFFARHPHTLLTSEQLAQWLGYEVRQIADSLETLLEAGFLRRSQNPTHNARLYLFDMGSTTGGWLPPLLDLASTREGKLALKEALSRRAVKDSKDEGGRGDARPRGRSPRLLVVRERPAKTG